MKHFLLRLCLVCLSLQLPAQWEWVKVFPKTHRGLDAKVDSKGNFYIITNYNIYQQGPYVIYKLDKNANQIGEIVLPKNVNCTGFDVRSDDKLFVGGYFRDTVQFNQTTLLSRGKEDAILIGLNSDLQIFDVRTFGGKFDDRITGIACDNEKRLFTIGAVCDTSQINDTTLICNKTGNSFLARFTSNLDLDYVVIDSTHENTDNDHWISFSSVQINKNNDILVSGVGKGKDYYSFLGSQINLAPNYYYHYYQSFAIQLDSSLNVIWSKSDKWDKYSRYEYTGFTTNHTSKLYHHAQPGYGGGTHLSLIYANGTEKDLVNSLWGAKYSMATIEDRFYFHRRYEVLDTSVHDYVQRNEFFALVDTQQILIDEVGGGIGSCKLLRNKSGEAYVVGVFIGPVTFGQFTVSTAVDDHKIFVAKLGETFKVGLSESQSEKRSISVGPNPSDGYLWLSEPLSLDAKVYVVSPSGQRTECRVDSKEIFLPHLSPGLHMIVIESANSRLAKKIVIR